MNHKKISIIIRSNCDISAITSLMQQNNNSWECYVVNNIIQNIEQFILNDNRFKILNNEQEAIKLSCGDYILFIDSSDILVNDAIDNILHTIQFTNADVIKFDSKLLKGDLPESADTKCKIKYIFNKNTVLNYAFNDLSEFCVHNCK